MHIFCWNLCKAKNLNWNELNLPWFPPLRYSESSLLSPSCCSSWRSRGWSGSSRWTGQTCPSRWICQTCPSRWIGSTFRSQSHPHLLRLTSYSLFSDLERKKNNKISWIVLCLFFCSFEQILCWKLDRLLKISNLWLSTPDKTEPVGLNIN